MQLKCATLAFMLAALAAAATASEAQQAYPTRPITIVVPAAAGGPTDTVARLIADPMSRTLGQQIVVENVGGAGGTIGVGRVAKAGGDGYTLLVWHIGQSGRGRNFPPSPTCSTISIRLDASPMCQ